MTRHDMVRYALGQQDLPALPDPLVNLTDREREIAALVADGMTNRQIAERLVVSPRTIEGHAGRILGKLGLIRRTELAAWMWRQARPLRRVRRSWMPVRYPAGGRDALRR